MIKQINQLKRLFLKNIWVTLGILFLLVLGVMQLNLTQALTDSDFTDTNTEVVDGNIQLKNTEQTWNTPRGSDIGPLHTVRSTEDNTNYYVNVDNRVQFCQSHGYTLLTYSRNTADKPMVSYWSTNYWRSGIPNDDYMNWVTCSTSDYETTGNIEQTEQTITSEPYNNFEVIYNSTLNGQSIQPYLLIGEDRHDFVDGKLSVSNVPAGHGLKLGFDFSGSTSSTPQLGNSITLLGSYVEASTNDATLSTISKSEVLASLKATPQTLAKTNPLRVASDFFYNIGFVVENFFKSIFN